MPRVLYVSFKYYVMWSEDRIRHNITHCLRHVHVFVAVLVVVCTSRY
jgi:hypothetical protein